MEEAMQSNRSVIERKNAVRNPWIALLAGLLLSCGPSQGSFVGTYGTTWSYDYHWPPGSRRCDGCTFQTSSLGTLDVASGPGQQLVFSSLQRDGGVHCIITGTVQSSNAFTVDTETDQGCQHVDPDGGLLQTLVQSGSGTIDGFGNLQLNASGSVTWTNPSGAYSANGTFEESIQAAIDGGQ
jgi:hypothetical protein